MAEVKEVQETAPGPSSQWPNQAKDYELKEVIGVGATAVVQVGFLEDKTEFQSCGVELGMSKVTLEC